MSNPRPPSFGARLRAARRVAGLNITTLGVRLGVGPFTVSRWERNTFVPAAAAHPAILAWAGTLPSNIGEPLAESLGLRLLSPPIVGEARVHDRAALERAVNDALLAAAESLDLGAKSFRRALLQVVAEMETAGAGLDVLKAVAARDGGGVREAKKKG